VRKDLSPKERVIGIEVKNETRAYPLAQLQKKPGITVPHIYVYWFAWQAFHPDTTVYGGKK
jgi:hypothetical protein